MQQTLAGKGQEQVLAVGLGALEPAPVEQGRTGSEAALRAGDGDIVTHEALRVLGGLPMHGVPLRHAPPRLGVRDAISVRDRRPCASGDRPITWRKIIRRRAVLLDRAQGGVEHDDEEQRQRHHMHAGAPQADGFDAEQLCPDR